MQYNFSFMPPSGLVEIHRRLLAAYRAIHGPLPCWKHLDPVSQLVHTMLGKRTRDPIAKQAFKVLCHRFMFWTDLLDLSPVTLQKLIEPVTFADRKAVELGQALQGVAARHGALELDFLDNWPVEPARSWLERLSGVGPKTSAAVVNFSTLKKPALVADTNYLRFSERFGLVATGASTMVAHRTLAALVPPDMTADHLEDHYALVKWHGQRICRHDFANCQACVLNDICKTGRARTTPLDPAHIPPRIFR